MIIFPAIDLKDGKCVRLERGDMAKETVFSLDPVAQAKIFEKAGFSWMHIVDLNGAFEGKPVNDAVVKKILAAVQTMQIQLGGGIRDLQTIEAWLAAGVRRVVLGTAALRDPDLVREASRLYPGRIAVGIDAKGGEVAVQGWAETSDMTVTDLAKRFHDAGVAAIIYTNIDRDGLKKGVDVEGTKALARAVKIPVIASGGVASMADLHKVKNLSADGIIGVIVGRAIYDGSIDMKQAASLL